MKNCRGCKFVLMGTEKFCPNCGQEINGQMLSTSLMSQVGLYAISIFLPPFGLGKTLKYIRSEDPRAKIIGWVSLGLTVTAITLGILSANLMVKNIYQQMNQELNVVGF